MNKTVSETRAYFERFLPLVEGYDAADVLVCPPFTSLQAAREMLEGSSVALGAQNCHYEDAGAYTGEVSLPMLKELGVSFVIVGHSERRHLFNESDELINKKLLACLRHGVRPVLCVGEKKEEREAGLTFKVVETQLRLALSGAEELLSRVEVAYEPVWAIGTGTPATPEQAQEVHAFIKSLLKELNPNAEVRVLYGGSVKPSNAKAFLEQPAVDGLLVGTASLDPESFAQIVKALE